MGFERFAFVIFVSFSLCLGGYGAGFSKMPLNIVLLYSLYSTRVGAPFNRTACP